MPHRRTTIPPATPSIFLPLYLYLSHFFHSKSLSVHRAHLLQTTRTNNACGWGAGEETETDREREGERAREGEREEGRHNKKSRSGSVNKMPNSSTCHNFSLARCRCPLLLLSTSPPSTSTSFDLAASSRALLPLKPPQVRAAYSLFLIRYSYYKTHTHTHIHIQIFLCHTDVQHKQTRRANRANFYLQLQR